MLLFYMMIGMLISRFSIIRRKLLCDVLVMVRMLLMFIIVLVMMMVFMVFISVVLFVLCLLLFWLLLVRSFYVIYISVRLFISIRFGIFSSYIIVSVISVCMMMVFVVFYMIVFFCSLGGRLCVVSVMRMVLLFVSMRLIMMIDVSVVVNCMVKMLDNYFMVVLS